MYLMRRTGNIRTQKTLSMQIRQQQNCLQKLSNPLLPQRHAGKNPPGNEILRPKNAHILPYGSIETLVEKIKNNSL